MTESPELRSRIMRAVHSCNTSPELAVRRVLRGLGYSGYRLHRRDLPGNPDIAYIGIKKAIFVHGCFWHRHAGCRRTTTPKSRVDFWENKFKRNTDRDRQNRRLLKQSGWSVLVIWECELKNLHETMEKIIDFLENSEVSSVP